MIPATYPSILDSSNRTKMLVYQVPSIVGLTRWIDYIPVKSPASESDLTLANTFANEGFILTSKVNDITGLVPFKDYVPIYLDSTATKAWSADNDGYIPMAELAGLLLDFTTGSLDSRINFSRTTNATVTNSAGQITYAPHNLLTYSEQFDNAAWSKTLVTVSANVITAPNGTLTADKVVESLDASPQSHAITRTGTTTATIVGTTYTTSVHLKAGERSAVRFYSGLQGGTKSFDVNLITGATSSVTVQNTPVVTPVGDGWLRISFTQTADVTTTYTPYIVPQAVIGSDAYQGNGTSGFYIWGAQLEIGSTATTYNPTTVKNLLGYSELFDNAAWTKSNSFVQTNLLTFSEDYSNVNWTKNNVSVITNSVIAPNGYQTADECTMATALCAMQQNITVTASTTYTFSFYALRGTATNLKYSVYNLTAASDIIAATSYYSSTSSTAWARITVTFTTPVGCTSINVYPLRDSGVTGTVYFWGAQLVQGSVAGDYRRTDSASLPCYYPNHNGVVCAEKFVEDTTASGFHRVFASVTTIAGTTYTQSIYAKAGERRFFSIRPESNANAAVFDLQLGTVTSTSAGVTATITSVGNGWYRCSATKIAAGTTWAGLINLQIDGDAGNVYTGDGTSGIYIFGAQLSDSASLDPYVLNAGAAPTAAAYYGARFDYDPVTLAPKGLLIEEQRSNLLLQSADLTTSWAVSNTTIDTTKVISPAGTLTGQKLIEDSALSTHYVYQTVTQATGAKVYSIYAKQATGTRFLQLRPLGIGTGKAYANFNLTTGVVGGTGGTEFTSSSIQSVGNGWYRCSLVMTNAVAPTGFVAVMVTSSSSVEVEVYQGDGTSGIYLWGAQLEAGAFATSYIPTAASQVTRAADVATIQGSNFYSWWNGNEGSYNINFDAVTQSPTSTVGNKCLVSFLGTTGNARFALGISWGGSLFNSANWGALAADNGSPALNLKNGYQKIAQAYLVTNTYIVANNNSVTTIAGWAGGQESIFIGQDFSGTRKLNGHIKTFTYYPQKLSDSVLKGLTA